MNAPYTAIPGATPRLIMFRRRGGTDYTLDHNTVLTDAPISAGILFASVVPYSPLWARLTISNNILQSGSYELWSSGTGCGFGSRALTCNTTSHTFARNALIGPWPTPGGVTPSKFTGADAWAAGFPANLAAVQFTNAAGGDYSLAPGSPYNNAGTDGKDLGVDMDGLTAATSGVSEGTPDDPPASASAALGWLRSRRRRGMTG